MGKRVLIVGCGYVGLPLGRELAKLGHEVFGLRRSSSADDALQTAGIQPLHADITRLESLAPLPRDFEWVVNCAATGGGTAGEYRQLYAVGNANLVAWLRTAPPRKFVYTSSTGVYGQDDGSVVVETDATVPAAETAQVLIATEQWLLAAGEQYQLPVVILRLAGIYGPDRGYWLKQFLSAQARLEGDGSRWLNLIHRDDVVGAILAALAHAPGGSVFNVVDDEPVRQRDLYAWLAATLNRALPPAAAPGAEASRKRAATSKRVSNEQLTRQLGFRCRHPTFREGFAAELKQLPLSPERPPDRRRD